jgi:hypothetical protein
MSEMKPLYKGLLLGVIQVAIVASLGGKMLLDRATRPRVWVLTGQYDPDLPIRGRYLGLTLQMPASGFAALPPPPNPINGRVWGWQIEQRRAELRVESGQLIAVPSERENAAYVRLRMLDHAMVANLSDPVLYFIPEHADISQRRPAGEELWVEITLPRKGPPRPIRLGVKKNGVLTPLDVR